MTPRTGPCRKCMFIRTFLMMAGPLIALLYLQPEWATRTADVIPSPEQFAWAIALAVPTLFVIKLIRPKFGTR